MLNADRLKTNKLAIYMLKPEYQRREEIVDATRDPIEIDGVGTFYFEDSHPRRPSWASDFFGDAIDGGLRILSASAKGILIVPIVIGKSSIHFAVAFGTGRHLLREGVVEERFGLKVVLNSIDQEHLRSIDKTTLGSVPKHSREQMSRGVQASEFGIDIEQDLISAITAHSQDDKLGKTITGKDALSISVKVNVGNIKDFLSYCYTRYRSDDYKKAFDWIDQIAEVRDKKTEEKLNADLVGKLIRQELGKIWMAVPEVINWSDSKGFRYLRAKRADLHDDLDVRAFLDELDGEAIDIEDLKNRSVFRISAKDDQVADKWSAFRCIHAEAEMDGKLFVLNNGKWYAIAQSFTEQVQGDFAKTPQSTIELPDCSGKDEGTYNKAVSDILPEICCLDRKMIEHGGGHSKIEFCDLYSSDRRIVHVKRYGGSSVLSHLFNQGVVSGELFAGDSDFRRKLNAILPDELRLLDPDDRPDAAAYEVVYAIISNAATPLDLPFFSKVSLRNARRRLATYGYKVSIKKIQKVEKAVE